MALIARHQVPATAPRKEAVPVPALGGDVIVRGLLLTERMALSAVGAQQRDPLPGETPEQAAQRAGRAVVLATVAAAVVLEDGEPVYTPAQWDEFGAQHPEAVLALYTRARALSGYVDDEPAPGPGEPAAEGAAAKN